MHFMRWKARLAPRQASCALVLVLFVAAFCSTGVPAEPDTPERQQIQREVQVLQERLRLIPVTKNMGIGTPLAYDFFADADVYCKGVLWALKYETQWQAADVALIQAALDRARKRIDALAAGVVPWREQRGRLVRGFVSDVDGSTQPYGLMVPPNYDATRPMRLDVVLHGSTRPTGFSELKFMSRFDTETQTVKAPPENDFIELHPLGRVENCYRWAGETDVFEAIEAVCRNYNIDRDRIVLRGMSMGASGTWHLGLKYPDRFVALGPYCGYVDTHQFSQTPLPNFIKVGELPPHQERSLHMLDSIDYAANAGVVPAIACMGEKDIFFQAHVLMGRAMEQEGLKLVNLISLGTGHVIDPVTHQEQMRRIAVYAGQGVDHTPKHLRFVTWTLKYSRCHWLQILALEEHYARAEVEATITDGGVIEMKVPKNVTRFGILPRVWPDAKRRLRISGRDVTLPAGLGEQSKSPAIVIERQDGRWVYGGEQTELRLSGKHPGLQGPIDDAFASRFLCVRGTGKPWHPAVHAWADASLSRFAYEWHRYFRGELPIKNDTDVSDDDLRNCHLVLFGDPGSNAWIRRVLPQLPLRWSLSELEFGGERHAAAEHAPVMIQPNPLAEGRYVVINTGHSFHEPELSSLNYLLFPRLGDWAIIKVGNKVPASSAAPLEDVVVRAGFFDEQWQFATNGVAGRVEPPSERTEKVLRSLFARCEQNENGMWQVLDQPQPQIADADLRVLAGLASLESLNLAFAKNVTDVGLANLKTLGKLRQLNLGGCKRVTDAGLQNLSAHESLQTLNLSLTQVSDEGAKLLAGFTNLRALDLDHTGITDEGLTHLARLKKLEYLRLAGLAVSDRGLTRLETLDKLKTLFLDGSAVTDDCVATLGSLRSLDRVSLAGTRVTLNGVDILHKLNPRLQISGP